MYEVTKLPLSSGCDCDCDWVAKDLAIIKRRAEADLAELPSNILMTTK